MYDFKYIVCIFVFTALIHCMICRDFNHTFVSFYTVLLFFSMTESARITRKGLVAYILFSSQGNLTYFYIVINAFAILVIKRTGKKVE